MQALRTRALAILMAVLLVVPLGSLGPAQYLCRMMGRIVDTSCCCGPRHEVLEVASGHAVPAIESQGCCQLVERSAREGVPAAREGALQLPAPVAVMAVPFIIDLPRRAHHRVAAEPLRARAPPRAGPPIFLKNCSLLT